MKRFEDIVDISSIGLENNSIKMNDILSGSTVSPATKDTETSLLLMVDIQKDFMQSGALGVPNSHKAVENLTKWIFNNIEKLTRCMCTLDTHSIFQIFHPSWFVDKNGNHPNPFTPISLKDLDDGKWIPLYMPIETRKCIESLEKNSKKSLMIWTYHCLYGTTGHSLESQLSNIINYHSFIRKSAIKYVFKGTDPISEMYGAFQPEYNPKNIINVELLNEFAKYDKIFISGFATDYCVYETTKQLLSFYTKDERTLNKIHILKDCMSAIDGSKTVEEIFSSLPESKHIKFVDSVDIKL